MPVADTSSLELVESICALPRPLMFLDTAGILDILRVPFRPELQVDIINSAAALVEDLSVAPRRIWVVSTANVAQEFYARREGVLQELSTRMSNLTQSIGRLSRIARLVVPERRVTELDWLDSTLEQRVLGVVDRLVASMSLFRGTPDCVGRARDRLWAGLPPASKSKQEFKDCEIFEEFLELAGALRRASFDQPIVFVTPNSKDYGLPPQGHQQIAADLMARGCLFAGNIAWARAVIQQSHLNSQT